MPHNDRLAQGVLILALLAFIAFQALDGSLPIIPGSKRFGDVCGPASVGQINRNVGQGP